MKPNQRVALTKQLVHRSLLALLQKKSLRQVSIRELCAEAGINRTTFYNHYGSQYDVLAEIADGYLAEIAGKLENADARDKESVHSRVALVLHFIQDNLELSSMLINNSIDETFAVRLFSLPKIGELLDTALADIQDQREKAAITAFAIHGSYKVLQDWINDPCRADPAQETELILGLAGRACGWQG
ncbi:MAG: TetR/AcrR family transcriptional regulator [Oscillospiraceae bacterium]